jgi:hypothetical protein
VGGGVVHVVEIKAGTEIGIGGASKEIQIERDGDFLILLKKS